MTINLNCDERLDDLGRKGYKLIQNKNAFCFGMDSVLLAAFAKANEEDKCIDLGCGNGIIPILLEARTNAKHIIGLEIQDISVDLAKRSVEYNGLNDKINIVPCQSNMCPVAQSCLTVCDPMDCKPPGSSVHGISQAGILEWAAISSRDSFGPRYQTCLLPWQAYSLPLSHLGSPI